MVLAEVAVTSCWVPAIQCSAVPATATLVSPLGWFYSTVEGIVPGNFTSVLFLSPPNDRLSFKIKSPVYSPQPEWILLSATENPPDVLGEPRTPDSDSMASPPYYRGSLHQSLFRLYPPFPS